MDYKAGESKHGAPLDDEDFSGQTLLPCRRDGHGN